MHTNIVLHETKINTQEELSKNTSKNIYYLMETYDAKSLAGIVSIRFTYNIKLTTQLPDSIERIIFDNYFDKKIDNGILPKHLKYLDLGWYFTNDINNDNLPESTETLVFGYWFNKNLFLKPRNLKNIIVNRSYKGLVSPELLHLMPESYREYYPTMLKNHNVVPENCQKIELEDDTKKEVNTEEIKYEMLLIDYSITTHFTRDKTNCTLDNKKIFLNEKNQIVIDLEISFWERHRVIYVGNNEKYYRTFWSHISIPKPYILYTDDERVGPFNFLEMIKNLKEYT